MGVTHAEMNERSRLIERALRNRQTPATVVGGKVLPAFEEYLLRPEPGTRVEQVRAAVYDLRLALGREDVRIGQSGTHLAVQVPRAVPQSVTLSDLIRKRNALDTPSFTAVMGVADDGSVLQARLIAPEVAHVLISGTTGSGKTSLALSMMQSLVRKHRPSELGLVLIDPKGSVGWVSRPHALVSPAREPQAALDALARVVKVMEGRVPHRDPLPRIVVYVDELADLVMSTSGAATEPITRIAQRGREVGVHLIACTQKPSAREIGTLLKANLPLRLCGRVLSPEDARVACGLPATGAESLRGNGDFLAVVGGRTVRFQAALPDPVDMCVPVAVVPAVVAAPVENVGVEKAPAEVVAEGEAAGIDEESVRAAVVILERRHLAVTRSRVLALLGYRQAGGASRRLNEIGEKLEIAWA